MEMETNNSTTSFAEGNQYINTNSCSSQFNCGQEYTILRIKLDELSKKCDELQRQNEMKQSIYDRFVSLLNILRYLLVAVPILSLIAIGIVSYLCIGNNYFMYSFVGLTGLTTLINGLFVPKNIREIEKRIGEIENKLNENSISKFS